jgi:hypothetical protein
MATHAEGSLSKLEREAEHTRADLIHTVDELHSRVSPQAIKEEVKAYARDTSNELIHNLERKACENPLQAVAVAAGLAYPAWRFMINIPAPILLVGAGLALSQFGGSSGRTITQDNTSGRNPESGEGEQLKDTVTRTVQEASSQVVQAVGGLEQKVADATAEAKATVKSGLGAIRSRAAAAINDTSNTASETMTAASEAVAATYRSGIDAASRTGDQLTDSFRRSKDSLIETIESHPFLVGGVGLLIGAVIASAFPVTQTENRLFGDSSDDLKDRGRDIASEGMEVAKSAAQDVYQKSVSRVQEEGLSPEVVRQTVKGVGDKVKNVVGQAANALEEKPEKTGSLSPSVVPHP